jgi:hypothetical protein
MPGPILHLGAVVMCSHGGLATPLAPNPRVLVTGMPIVTIAVPYGVTGCTFGPPAGNGPCVTAHWVVGAMRVTSNGQPVVITTGVSICVPTGTPLIPVEAQTRAIAS